MGELKLRANIFVIQCLENQFDAHFSAYSHAIERTTYCPAILYPLPTTKCLFKIMTTSQQIIEQTQKWINNVVVACHFCPFAAQVINQNKVHYQVEISTATDSCIRALLGELTRLDTDNSIETSFLIFPEAFTEFNDFLELVSLAEKLLKRNKYVGIYQLASFHPLYQFANSAENDAANFTNRSIYPMLHLLREASIDKALEHYRNPENIPVINVEFARGKGVSAMKNLRESCF